MSFSYFFKIIFTVYCSSFGLLRDKFLCLNESLFNFILCASSYFYTLFFLLFVLKLYLSYHQSSPKPDKSLSKKTRLRSVLFNAKFALLLAFSGGKSEQDANAKQKGGCHLHAKLRFRGCHFFGGSHLHILL